MSGCYSRYATLRAESTKGTGMRKSHKGPNRNFVGLDEWSKNDPEAQYIYIYMGDGWLDGRAGPEKCLLLNGRGDTFAHDVRDL